MSIEHGRQIGGVVSDWQHVSGTVVEVVSAADEVVCIFVFEGGFGKVEGIHCAMDIGDD